MRERGFTLVELLVSLFIFGLLSAAAVALLSVGVRAQELAGTHLDRLAELRRASALMAADLAQAAPRTFRDSSGARHAAFIGDAPAGDAPFLIMVRRGWESDGSVRRSTLQKVAYRLTGGRLERVAFPLVDGAEALAPVTVVGGVKRLEMRYRGRRGEWRGRWEPEDPAELPVAVEMVAVTGEEGAVRQLFLSGGAE